MRSPIEMLADRPQVFDLLRSVLEGGYRGHHRIIAQHLMDSGCRVLDIGCGTGIYARHFDPSRYLGIDISPVYVAAAASKFPQHQFRVMDATALEFNAGEFDSAFISGVLHHLSDADALSVIQEAARVVRPGGVLVIWEDIPAPWWNLVGHVIHRLDLGSYIRSPPGYLDIVRQAVPVTHHYQMRSGCMDYTVLVCQLPGQTDADCSTVHAQGH